MNVYEKILRVRVGIINANLKPSGKNSYSGFTYFDLGDLIPTLEKLCDENKLFTIVSHYSDKSTLTIVNAEAPEETVVVNTPASSASLKAAHDVQNLGAVQTYLRRYLYLTAFNIVEHDNIDGTSGKESKKEAPSMPEVPPEPISKEQKEKIYVFCKQLAELQAVPIAEVFAEIEGGYKTKIEDMTAKQGLNLTKQLIQKLNKYNEGK